MHLNAEVATRPRHRLPDGAGPETIIDWAVARFFGQRCLATTAFGMDGCAMLDMLAKRVPSLDVYYIDTDFLFAETYALRDRMAARYPNLNFIRGHCGVSPDEQARRHGDRLWERDPDLCCRLRKVEPMNRIVADADVWFTSIRRSQSVARAGTETVAWDWQYELLKVCPLAAWRKDEVWSYIQANDVPHNPLHHNGYPSIGCTHCTKAVPGACVTTDSRAGRWGGSEKTECGLHGDGI
ncbi:MAG: phosphoadenylyl-sulfate reductase [Phycisphaerae bacterium]